MPFDNGGTATRSTTIPNEGFESFLSGGGEIGERIRAFDWAASPLGPPSRWPQSLRSAVSILLPSRAQIVLFWGPELVTLYNDAYRPVFGAKHPAALGRPTRECWHEIWDVLGPLLSEVVTTGQAFWAKDYRFLLDRHGFIEETYFDVSYDPVRDESGRVGGVFCIVSETTGRVVGERRLRVLRDLDVRAADARSAEDACRAAAEALGATPDVPGALIYLHDRSASAAWRLVAHAGSPPSPAAATPHDDVVAEALAAHGARVVKLRLAELFSVLPGDAADPEQVVVVPLVAGGAVIGALVAAVSRHLQLGRSTSTSSSSSRRASPPAWRAPSHTRRSAGAPKRSPSWTARRPRSSATSRTSSALRSR